MRGFVALLTGLLCLSAAIADDVKDKAVKAELEKLKCKWKLVSTEFSGQERPTPEVQTTVVTIEGTRWTAETGKSKVEEQIKIDPTGSPKSWDSTRKDDAGKEVVRKQIYKLDEDTLTICVGYGELIKERPKNFKTMDGTRHIAVVRVYKRVKEWVVEAEPGAAADGGA